MRILLALCALALLPSAAHAEWLEASSAHFVVYADDTEKDVRRFSEQLELYHESMASLTRLDMPPPSPSNRLTVFVVKNEREVRRIYGEGARYVGGFYIPRAGGSVAFVPPVEQRRGPLDYSMLTLLHEYAHHFLISNSTLAAPRWYQEGAAEFFASAEFPSAGGIRIGMPAYHRAGELLFAREVSVEQLLDPAAYQDGVRKGFDSFYGKSWLLYHYLVLGPKEREGQLRKYLSLMATGTGSREAGEQAFGNFKQLDRELDKYLTEKIMTAQFAPDQLQISPIALRRLTAGEVAIMPVVIRSRRGVDKALAEKLVAEARTVAVAHPADAAVLAALAEAEFDAGDDAKAIAAADAALAIDPQRVNALVQKGYALFRQAGEADDREAAFKEAIKPFLALNKFENDHPLPLVYYFRGYVERGQRPTDQAMLGLERATELAPFDFDLRFNLASNQIAFDQFEKARHSLEPLAYNPHGGPLADAARRVIERIDAGVDTANKDELFQLLSSRQQGQEAAGASES